MKTFVLGVYDASANPSAISARRSEIARACRALKFPRPTFDTPDFLDATIRACDLREANNRVWLVGSLSDLKAPGNVGQPDRGFSDEEWREGWLAYLGEEALAWKSTDRASIETVKLSRVSVIRSYRRAWRLLMQLLAKARSRRSKDDRASEPRYTSGRPPYGYRAKDGCLEHDAPGVLARVRKVYELIRRQVPVSKVVALMQESEAMRPQEDRKFWDTVKVRRLLSHAPLYCLGEYRTGKIRKRAPELAFLPAGWAGTVPHRKEAQAKTAVANAGGVSSRPRSGKVRASASTTSH